MYVGVLELDLLLGEVDSLKYKRAVLRPVLARPNLTVLTGAHVTRVLMHGDRASGVEWLRHGQKAGAQSDGEVILSGGTVQSPQLLQLSGIGPAEVLRKAGVGVVLGREQVGANLQDHY